VKPRAPEPPGSVPEVADRIFQEGVHLSAGPSKRSASGLCRKGPQISRSPYGQRTRAEFGVPKTADFRACGAARSGGLFAR
jgi:hypothetical protein